MNKSFVLDKSVCTDPELFRLFSIKKVEQNSTFLVAPTGIEPVSKV